MTGNEGQGDGAMLAPDGLGSVMIDMEKDNPTLYLNTPTFIARIYTCTTNRFTPADLAKLLWNLPSNAANISSLAATIHTHRHRGHWTEGNFAALSLKASVIMVGCKCV